MGTIYDQHRAAFSNVSAYVVVKDGKRVATIAFKYPRDGAGRLYAYVHWVGLQMVRGFAAGGGYDKHTAACADAARRLPRPGDGKYACGTPHHDEAEKATHAAFCTALERDGGHHWDRMLRDAGFEVWSAI